MAVLTDILIVIISILITAKGASWLVDSSIRIAKKLGISELVIGLTIVAAGTSAPEFGVTLLAAFRGMGDISVGNIVGSNVFNLGFILGGTAIIRNLSTNRKVVIRDGGFLLVGTLILTFFLWDLSLSMKEGSVLLIMLIVYLGHLFWNKEPIEHESEQDTVYNWYDPLLLILGLAMVIISSHFLVDSASDLAELAGISQWVIGATIVAAGTSAPELATSVVAAIKGNHGISVGNLLGSDIFNMYGVLSTAAIMRELPVDIEARSNMILLILMVILVIVFMRTNWRVSRMEGVFLIILGLSRWVYSFL
ncbi:MAG: sodium:calcium antiporter [Bacteroidetes bacterium]|nr:sodium:calcium antiporter [Bacteroidota bacterium]